MQRRPIATETTGGSGAGSGLRLSDGPLRSALRYGLFPGTMILAVACGLLLFEDSLAAYGMWIFFGSIPVFFVLERMLPWREAWLGNRGDVGTDVGLVATSGLAAPIQERATELAVLALAATLAERSGGGVWPAHWPLLAQGVLALVVGDFFRYWVHRALHEVPLLWRIHATHHSARRLYFFNGARIHPLEVLVSGFVEMTPLVLLGVTPEALAVRFIMGRVIGRFQHCNLDVDLGPLDYVFSTPRNHRWHHSKDLREAAHNYGGDIILFDHLFGTFYMPRDVEPPDEIGIENMPDFPTGIWGVLVSPFRWRRHLAQTE